MANLEAPVLSTPATHILEEPASAAFKEQKSALTNDEIQIRYEIERTLEEIGKAKYTRVALQFPDSMLPDAPMVFDLLIKSSNQMLSRPTPTSDSPFDSDQVGTDLNNMKMSHEETPVVRFYILADTSYGACCVDEVAAEHVNADVVVHYGRACLSPTSRIPVIHVFTIQPLDEANLIRNIEEFYTDVHDKLILMADVMYHSHLRRIFEVMKERGYRNLFMTEIVYHPSSPLPNRTVPDEVTADPSMLRKWCLFHISDPAESLLLTLASRVAAIRISPTISAAHDSTKPFLASTSRALNRRYALLTSVATVSIFGILINTLSVKNYLHIVDHVKSQILAAGKKSYTFVVGKINAAKVANFGEIGAWVVIGCWESSLIDSKDFWKPLLTPFELDLALQGDQERVWTGEWSSDFQRLLDKPVQDNKGSTLAAANEPTLNVNSTSDGEFDSEPDSAPPEFDLRKGRYVSHTRPMQTALYTPEGPAAQSKSLIKRVKGEVAIVGGEASPGAEYLKSTRSWKGLGSDFEIAYEGTGAAIEQGRSGIARGYMHGENHTKT